MKQHRQWETIIGYFRSIPIDSSLTDLISNTLKDNKNVLVMIKKDNQDLNPRFTQKEKFDELCKIFPKETKIGKLIISAVPDIVRIREYDY